MTKCVLMVDLEGSITDNSPRLHFMKSGLWDEYEAAGPDDPINKGFGVFLASLFWAGCDFVVVTGRYEKYRARTVAQLGDAGIHPDHLLMRDNLDIPKTKEPALKLQFLEHIRALYGDEDYVVIAMDDKDDVVEALRNAGIDCWQVRNGQPG